MRKGDARVAGLAGEQLDAVGGVLHFDLPPVDCTFGKVLTLDAARVGSVPNDCHADVVLLLDKRLNKIWLWAEVLEVPEVSGGEL